MHLRVIGSKPEAIKILYGASVNFIKDLLRIIGFHPEANSIWGLGYLCLMQDTIIGLLVFTPK